MLIISIKDNENNSWKRSAKKKNEDRKEQSGTDALVKGWELHDFAMHLSWVLSN